MEEIAAFKNIHPSLNNINLNEFYTGRLNTE